jgi:flagellar biosynthetic protein FliP
MREFMFDQTRTKDLALFARLAKLERPKTRADIPTYVLIPAFTISELKTAFQIGFLIFLPFLIIDLVVGATLMSMGMMMLPPVFISLPFKILLFVLVDGWNLVTQSLVQSFHT